MSLSGRYVIGGIGHTAFGKLPGRDTVSMNVEACRNALADAGTDKSVVDAVFVKVPSSAHEFMYGQKVAEALAIDPHDELPGLEVLLRRAGDGDRRREHVRPGGRIGGVIGKGDAHGISVASPCGGFRGSRFRVQGFCVSAG